MIREPSDSEGRLPSECVREPKSKCRMQTGIEAVRNVLSSL